jgi:hypothetical protein
MIKKNDFTYGVEIEGAITRNLHRKLMATLPEYVNIDYESDGSAMSSHSTTIISQLDSPLQTHLQEVKLGIFEKYNDLINAVACFENGVNYGTDFSCGLHIHIKPKGTIKQQTIMKNRIMDMKLITKLQNFAENLSPVIKERLIRRGSWCHEYKGLNDTRYQLRISDKCRFMRQHDEYGTLEFRFFSPYNNKLNDIKHFFDYFFELLNDKKLKKKVKKVVIKPADLKKDLHYNWKIDKNKVINTCYEVKNNLDKAFSVNLGKCNRAKNRCFGMA